MARWIACWIAVAAVAALAAPALGQGTGVRDVGVGRGINTGFHGTLGSTSLDTFRSFSSGSPSASGQTGTSSPLTPGDYRLSNGPAGGIGKDLRIDPFSSSSAILPVLTPITRSSSFGLGSPAMMIPPAVGGANVTPPGGANEDSVLGPAGELPSHHPFSPAVDLVVKSIGGGTVRWPVGVPHPKEAGESDQSSAISGSSARNAVATMPFDLAGQVAINPRWQRGEEWLKRRQPAKAIEPIRVGRVFAPDRAEGDWLLAVAEAGVDEDAAAVARLRDGLTACADLLTVPRGAAVLLGSDIVDRRIASASPPAALADGAMKGKAEAQPAGSTAAAAHAADRSAPPAAKLNLKSNLNLKCPAERLIVAAWLAWEAGKVNTARELLSQLPDLAEPAATVADALRLTVGLPVSAVGVEGTAAALSGGSASATAKPAQTASADAGENRIGAPLGDWFNSVQGQFFGMPPVQVQFQYGRPVQPH